MNVLCVLGRRGHVVLEAFKAVGLAPPIPTSGRTRLTAVNDVVRQLRRGGVRGWDIVLADSVETVPLARWLSRRVRGPLVVRVRGNVWDEVGQQGRRGVSMRAPGVGRLVRAYTGALESAAAVVPVCASLGRDVAARVPASRSKTTVIPISVDATRFGLLSRTEARGHLALPRELTVALTVTNFRFPAKTEGLSRRLPIMRELMERVPSLVWAVAGAGPARTAFSAEAVRVLGSFRSRLLLTGLVPNIASWYSAADLVLQFTALDAMPRAVFEAQASRLPVIADAVGGIAEMIETGRTGYVLQSDDQLRELVLALLSDAPLRERIGASARADVVERFSPTAVGGRWLALFHRIAA